MTVNVYRHAYAAQGIFFFPMYAQFWWRGNASLWDTSGTTVATAEKEGDGWNDKDRPREKKPT